MVLCQKTILLPVVFGFILTENISIDTCSAHIPTRIATVVGQVVGKMSAVPMIKNMSSVSRCTNHLF